MKTLFERMSEAQSLHGKLIECHPSLARRQVWCTTCGATQRVDNGLRDGWPKHCGYTMTIDSPEERIALAKALPTPNEEAGDHIGDER